MRKRKSIIILLSSLVLISLVSYITFADGNNKDERSPLDYGLFASENIQMSGSGCDIKADIWANNFLGFFGNGFEIRGNTWSSNDIKKSEAYWDSVGGVWQNSSLDIGDRSHIITAKKEMINIMDTIKETAKSENNYREVNGDLNFSNLTSSEIELNKSYIVSGNITVSINEKNLNSYLIADGKIDINLNNYKGTVNKKQDVSNIKSIVIASNKDITIRGNPVIVGTIYAPNGTVKIEGSGTYVIGNIIAKNIIVNGSGLFMNDEKKIIFNDDL